MAIYNEEHNIFRTAFKKFIEKELAPHIDEWEQKREIPRSVWRKFGEYGYLCPWLPEKYGGSETGFEYSMIIIEELTRAGINGAVVGIGVHSDIVAPYLNSYGNEEQKTNWLPGCGTGEIITAIAMTEPNTGSDLQSIKTTAKKEGDYYIINGQKTFISNGISADLVIVACKTTTNEDTPYKGISLIVVEDGTPGFNKGRKLNKLGLHSQDTAELFFEDCKVSVKNLLGHEGMGFSYMMKKLQQERLVSAAISQYLAERMLSGAIEYSKSRKVFGKPVSRQQHNSFKIAEMATEIELGRVFLESLIADHLIGMDIVTRVSMAKWWVAEMANRVAYNSLQLYGGYGYTEEYPIARDYRDVRAHTIFAGSTEVMKLIIARKLGL
ncbi:acyl-CoA dehydrogenase family protein [Desulfoscipio sp. XC116]|uniref:acyl-CoA dehydrogenase family protein n=1 Tax=Desulfoscipio sp. XC116 TaxID=3144975 RepID=UPI00325B187B